jgi:phage baseplate assembly protein W
MYTSLRRTLNDNFKNLLMTDHGERLAIYDFGANLRELTFEMSAFNKEEFDSEAVIRIKTSANKYMPFLQLKTFESSVDHHDNSVVGKVVIRITYDIPRLNVQDQAQEVTLFVGG